MKLKNKISGEIKEFALFDGNELQGGATLESLMKEWEDYEEMKGYWYINEFGTPTEITHTRENIYDKQRKNFDNYFDTREEAEKAVEKLKAVTKLKEFGFRFIDWELDMKTVADGKVWFDIGTNTEWDAERLLELKPEVKESLDILFGGEE